MVEKECPAVVSCADILALATRDSVVYLGGPSWEVGLRRRDSTTASRLDANNSIPTPSFSLSTLKQNFANQGLSEKDLVALSEQVSQNWKRQIARTPPPSNSLPFR
ncbi:peroxidase P7-like isoform X1 [Arachis hypogaea]|uniref:peroxidase P7-like isoform X1 n=1 Tax=Arachis hypogaea TaxID=3818 RepID=UPI000DECE3F1|nr:peroxidase P7-like isoform X1 [Arachis hypogaea]